MSRSSFLQACTSCGFLASASMSSAALQAVAEDQSEVEVKVRGTAWTHSSSNLWAIAL